MGCAAQAKDSIIQVGYTENTAILLACEDFQKDVII